MLSLFGKIYCCRDVVSNNLEVSSKGPYRPKLEQKSDQHLEKFRKVLDDAVKITLTNRGFGQKITQLQLMKKPNVDRCNSN